MSEKKNGPQEVLSKEKDHVSNSSEESDSEKHEGESSLASTKGGWTARGISDWNHASELIKQHKSSKWHQELLQEWHSNMNNRELRAYAHHMAGEKPIDFFDF